MKPHDPQPRPGPDRPPADTVDTDYSPAIAAEFVALYLADCSAGGPSSLAHYLARFVGFESTVRTEFERMQSHGDIRTDEMPSDEMPSDEMPSDGVEGGGASEAVGEPAARVGRFELQGELGRGGQAVVYRAFDPRLRREVALKVLPRAQLLSAQASLRFEREARVAARLEHPNICRVFDSGVTEDGVPFIAMQFLSGQTVREWAANTAPGEVTQSVATTVPMIEAVARALHYAHQHGVLHRDIKPGNIMLTEAGQPVLLDFGLAAFADQDGDDPLTLSGDRFGTPAYMAPEQVLGPTAELGPETDVYALGLVLFELLSGRQASTERSGAPLSRASIMAPLADVRRHNRAVSADLAAVVGRAVAPDRSDRYASAGELADELRRVDEGLPVRARRSSVGVRLLRWAQRNPVVAGATGAVFAATLLGLIVALFLLERATDAEATATAQRDAARWSSYVAQLPAAQRSLDVGQVTGARAALDRAPVEHRSVGWFHLDSVLASHEREWFGPGAAVVALGTDGGGERLAGLDETGRLRVVDRRDGSVATTVLVDEPVVSARIDRRGRAVLLVGSGPARRVLGFSGVFETPRRVGPDHPAAGQRLGGFVAGPGFCVALIGAGGVRRAQLDGGEPNPTLLHRAQRVHSVVADRSASGSAVLIRKLLEQRGQVRFVGHDLARGELQVDEEVDGRLGPATWAGRDRLVTTVSDVYDQQARAILWDVVGGRRIATQSLGRAKITAAASVDSAGIVLLGDEVGRLHVLDATLRPIANRYGHRAEVREILTLPGETVLTASADGRVLEWRLRRGAPRQELPLSGRIAPTSLAFDETGALLAVGSSNARLEVVDTDAGRVVRIVPVGRHTQVGFARGGSPPVVSVASRNHRSMRRVLLDDGGARQPKVESVLDVGTSGGLSPCIGPGGRFVFAPIGGVLCRVDLDSGQSTKLWPIDAPVLELVHAGSVPVVAWAQADGRVLVRSLEAGAATTLADSGSVESLAIDRSGDLVAFATRTEVHLHSVGSHRERQLHVAASSLVFSPDSRRLLVGLRSREVALFDVDTGIEIMRFDEMPGLPTALAFDHGGQRLAVGCTGGWLVLLGIRRQARAARRIELAASGPAPTGLDAAAQRLAFPRDNHRAAKDWVRIEEVLEDPFAPELWHRVAARAADHRLGGDVHGRSNLGNAALGALRLGEWGRARELFERLRRVRPTSPRLAFLSLVGGAGPEPIVASDHGLARETRLRRTPAGAAVFGELRRLLSQDARTSLDERLLQAFGRSPEQLAVAERFCELDVDAPEHGACFAFLFATTAGLDQAAYRAADGWAQRVDRTRGDRFTKIVRALTMVRTGQVALGAERLESLLDRRPVQSVEDVVALGFAALAHDTLGDSRRARSRYARFEAHALAPRFGGAPPVQSLRAELAARFSGR